MSFKLYLSIIVFIFILIFTFTEVGILYFFIKLRYEYLTKY